MERRATTDPTWTEGHEDSFYQSCRATQVRTIKSRWDNETQVTKIKQRRKSWGKKKNTRRRHYQNKTGNTQTEDDGNYFQNMLQQSYVHSTVHIFTWNWNIKGPVWDSGEDRATLVLLSINLTWLFLGLDWDDLHVTDQVLTFVSPAAFNSLLSWTGRKIMNQSFILVLPGRVPDCFKAAGCGCCSLNADAVGLWRQRRHQFCF